MGFAYRLGVPEEFNGPVYVAFTDGRQVFVDPLASGYAEALERLMDMFEHRPEPQQAFISTKRLGEANVRELVARLDLSGDSLDLPDPVIGWVGR